VGLYAVKGNEKIGPIPPNMVDRYKRQGYTVGNEEAPVLRIARTTWWIAC